MDTKRLDLSTFQCGLCEEIFTDKTIAASHLSVTHNTTKEFLIELKPHENEIKSETMKQEYSCD